MEGRSRGLGTERLQGSRPEKDMKPLRRNPRVHEGTDYHCLRTSPWIRARWVLGGGGQLGSLTPGSTCIIIMFLTLASWPDALYTLSGVGFRVLERIYECYRRINRKCGTPISTRSPEPVPADMTPNLLRAVETGTGVLPEVDGAARWSG